MPERSQNTDRDRKVKAGPFFFHVSRSEIHDDFFRREGKAAVFDSGLDALFGFFHSLVRQTHKYHLRQAGRNIHLESDASLTGVNNIGILSAATVEKVTAAAVTLTSDNKFKLEDAGGGTTLASIGITSNTYSIDATTTIDTISLLSTSSAGNAIEITDNTLRQLNNLRSKIGALQNRLESTRRNLSTTYENLSAARSRILDADIAVETAEMTKMQILQQAGLAVLAQANMAPQAVLSLLQ